jgi:hypothetical protein
VKLAREDDDDIDGIGPVHARDCTIVTRGLLWSIDLAHGTIEGFHVNLAVGRERAAPHHGAAERRSGADLASERLVLELSGQRFDAPEVGQDRPARALG